jgi:hypothetical protein
MEVTIGGSVPVGTLGTDPVALGHFIDAQDSRRALSRRSWCLTGHVTDSSDRRRIARIIERWNGEIAPETESVT